MALNALMAVGDSLKMAFFMFWETLWALVLGFGLSGAVQAFVSRADMQRALGGHRLGHITRAAGFGAISSSCSYAATAMAKSLFQKGADFTSSMVFMFASTNLVLELGVVLWVLLGWQFAVSEFVGGAIMIALLVLVSRWFFKPALTEAARHRLQTGASGATQEGHEPEVEDGDASLQREPWRKRLSSPAGWADAASYTLADLTMLRREIVIGYVVAGFLAVLVPSSVWNLVFLRGHGFWTSLENVVVGPFIALISFVCSIGNVPLAAALWTGGFSFGGVVSFVFADLISLPLLLIYRKYYGGRLTLRMLAAFWLVMAAAGLATEYIFLAAGVVPAVRPVEVVEPSWHWNYTTFLNFGFLVVFGALVWLSKHRSRMGGGAGYAIDPVCGMQVQTANAPARATVKDQPYYFCSDHCREHFEAQQRVKA